MTNEEARDKLCDLLTTDRYVMSEHYDAVVKGVEALGKLIPTKPIWQGDEDFLDAYCPYCGEILDAFYETPCESCNQFIDWSVEDGGR